MKPKLAEYTPLPNVYQKIIVHLRNLFPHAPTSYLKTIFPDTFKLEAWGKLLSTTGGDMMHARGILGDASIGRDMSYVKVRPTRCYTSLNLGLMLLLCQYSKFANAKNANADAHELESCYGQLSAILVLPIPGPDARLRTTAPRTIVLAVVLPAVTLGKPTGTSKGMRIWDGKARAAEVIDAQYLDEVVGRVVDGRDVVFFEKMGSKAGIEVLDSPDPDAL